MTVIAPLPPLPPGDYTRPGGKRDATIPYWHAPAGYCRWCGEDLEVRLKDGSPDPNRRWHPTCVTARFSYTPAAQRRRIWDRELGECQGCGRFVPFGQTSRAIEHESEREATKVWYRLPTSWRYYTRWAVDHITPLWAGGSNEDQNLQLLCDPCHKAKTAAEATPRAARRREHQGQAALIPTQATREAM